MSAENRREFLCRLGRTGAALVSGSWLSGFGYIPSNGPAHAIVDVRHSRSQLDRRLFGGFLEHLGRAVYGGIYEPESALSDEFGFRCDVADCVRQLEVPVIRYPGGNFVSDYNWQEGVGPVDDRPAILNRAWNSIETNRFGTNEFMQWCDRVNAEPMLVFNLGTNTPEMAAAYVDYCNGTKGTRWSELRKQHGFESPYGVQLWGLGNELDGPWEIGHMPVDRYSEIAIDTARRVRSVDPTVQLVAAGSSNTELSTYLHWDYDVLERCYDDIDAIALHNYYGNTNELTKSKTSRYLAMNLDMERQIQEIAAVCDFVQERRRSPKKLWLAFDEWNVWYRARTPAHMDGGQQVAPRLLEEVYNLEDALLVGGIINTLLRQSARVRVACLAQLVNVIAPLVTNGAGLLKQSIYYPYAWALAHARGRVLEIDVNADTYPIESEGLRQDFARDDLVPFLDLAVTMDDERGAACVLVLNRDLDRERDLTLAWEGALPVDVLVSRTLTGADLKASNTFERPGRVAPQELDTPNPGRKMTFKLPPASYSIIKLAMS